MYLIGAGQVVDAGPPGPSLQQQPHQSIGVGSGAVPMG